MKLASSYDRVDAVFDRYFDKNLKEGTRKGDDMPIPNNMAEGFSENKKELKEYLGK